MTTRPATTIAASVITTSMSLTSFSQSIHQRDCQPANSHARSSLTASERVHGDHEHHTVREVMLPASSDERTRQVLVRIGTIVAALFVTALREAGIDVDQPQRLESLAADV